MIQSNSVYLQVIDNPADAHKVGQRIKRMYVDMKKSQLGKTRYTLHPRYQSEEIWDKAGEIAIELEVSPATYVEAIFEYNTVPGGPFPQQMGGKSAARWVKEYADNEGSIEESVKQRLLKMLAYHRKAWSLYEGKLTLTEVILHPAYQSMFPAYLLCAAYPKKEIHDAYGKEARMYIEENPHIFPVLKSLRLCTKWARQ